jgi:hypothetical protein
MLLHPHISKLVVFLIQLFPLEASPAAEPIVIARYDLAQVPRGQLPHYQPAPSLQHPHYLLSSASPSPTSNMTISTITAKDSGASMNLLWSCQPSSNSLADKPNLCAAGETAFKNAIDHVLEIISLRRSITYSVPLLCALRVCIFTMVYVACKQLLKVSVRAARRATFVTKTSLGALIHLPWYLSSHSLHVYVMRLFTQRRLV